MINEILELTTIDNWYNVLSGSNPADTGTRGIFFWKPSRIAAGLLVQAFSGLLIGPVYATKE